MPAASTPSSPRPDARGAAASTLLSRLARKPVEPSTPAAITPRATGVTGAPNVAGVPKSGGATFGQLLARRGRASTRAESPSAAEPVARSRRPDRAERPEAAERPKPARGTEAAGKSRSSKDIRPITDETAGVQPSPDARADRAIEAESPGTPVEESTVAEGVASPDTDTETGEVSAEAPDAGDEAAVAASAGEPTDPAAQVVVDSEVTASLSPAGTVASARRSADTPEDAPDAEAASGDGEGVVTGRAPVAAGPIGRSPSTGTPSGATTGATVAPGAGFGPSAPVEAGEGASSGAAGGDGSGERFSTGGGAASSEGVDAPAGASRAPAAGVARPVESTGGAVPTASAGSLATPPAGASGVATPAATPTAVAFENPESAGVRAEARFAAGNVPQITTAIRGHLLPTGGTMQIRLDPPELGALLINVTVRNGVLEASFQTNNAEATQLLSHSLTQLKHALESQGVGVDRLQVAQTAPRPTDRAGDAGGQDRGQQQPGSNGDSAADWSRQGEQQRRELLKRMWARLGVGDPLDLVA